MVVFPDLGGRGTADDLRRGVCWCGATTARWHDRTATPHMTYLRHGEGEALWSEPIADALRRIDEHSRLPERERAAFEATDPIYGRGGWLERVHAYAGR